MFLPVLFLSPFFIFYLPVQYWIGSKGIGGLVLMGILLSIPILLWIQKRRKKEPFLPLIVSPGILISYWSLFVFTEGIFYTATALDSFFLGDFDYTAQTRMIVPTIEGKFFQTQYYGPNENANFLSHHMTPGSLLLTPFPILFGSKLGFGIGIFFFASITIPLLYHYLRTCSISEELSLCASLLWSGSSSFYRLNHSLHFEVLVPFLCLCVLIGIQKRKFWITLISLCFFLGIKEDLSIYLAALAIALIPADKKRNKEWTFVFIICIFYYFIIFPILNEWAGISAERNWKEYWDTENKNPISIFLNYIQNSENRSQYWKGIRDLSLEWGFWNLTGGWILLPFFGLYSVFRLSIHPWVRDSYSYYVYPLIPFLILFLKTGAIWIQDRTDQSKTKFPSSVSKEKKLIFILILTFSFSIHRNSKESEYPIALSPKPDRTAELENILKEIPAGSSVSAGFHLSPFVSLKNPVYPIREDREWKEWILLDQEYNSPYLSSAKISERVDVDVLKGKLRWVRKTNRFGLLRLNAKP
ncbi:DUF2079 domain-containing protein [Leptospira borgpetersenii serovar Hardjo-bovis]|uniref:Membrane protein, PF09852 family n=1 Tax=Leptospira borgpetersenii serovar Hardjo-bovis str. Sponselee TaxID=1303729 RepID=M6C093_LEPBO|nr:DUF2079 domain-containing protein [Leptospira borgpetersenii]ABJ78577.1 Conserved hypothetical protein [Leptospira borgpetersenii serovar Hardjo-bovis str. L550]AMX57840.1 membrane protein [Leptospira borgpetersenii serovar Hardjo]AMX61073.1 membrane protein [Leptospira borgpetersenii serovar Hardjo]AMX64316.1 membrane protein [Leptospira borgpetersenii serovar Hardjo]AMX67557.1 membrane protein [Leptospira borgpetersenii serovar Hardjo]